MSMTLTLTLCKAIKNLAKRKSFNKCFEFLKTKQLF